MREKDYDKFKDLLVYAVSNTDDKDGVYETKLWKLLYFCDADFYEKYDNTITEVDYIKNHFGPTPEIKIIKAVLAELKGVIIKKKVKNRLGKDSYVYIRGDVEYKFEALSGEELEDARQTLEKYQRLSAGDIMKLSHTDPPFLAACSQDTIEFRHVNYRQDDIDIGCSEKVSQKEAREALSNGSVIQLLNYATENA